MNRVYTPTAKTPDNMSPVDAEAYRRLGILQKDLRVRNSIILPFPSLQDETYFRIN